eukprot:TRINITY_DN4873_c0_g1_i1.p1 TRINITY_DN4873_c0_g1~~TRINITY_DN4873_c0_g1_i1.p1  ORF type:complete len:186 (-),score=35.35 TRINITY_DN4873_c0_g1_i1:154-636(-)
MSSTLARALCCSVAVLFALACLPESFVPSISGAHGAPEAPLPAPATRAAHNAPFAVEAIEQATSSYTMPLALGLAMGLVLALPKSALAAGRRGNEDPAVLINRVLNEEQKGALGIDDLTWLQVYLGVFVAALGTIGLGVVGAFLMPRPAQMEDGKYKGAA